MSGRDTSGRFLAWQPTPVFLPGESQGQRSLAGHSPWDHKESDMTEAIEHTCTQITVESILLYLRASETANLSKLRFVGLAVFKTVLPPPKYSIIEAASENIQKTKIMAPDPISSVQFSCSVMSNSLRPHETQQARPPCPSPIPGVYPNSWPLSP